MNWDAIGAVGEIIGAVAVVVTLVHLSRQIRLANIAGIASGYLGHPGTRELWGRIGHCFAPIEQLVDEALSES